MAHERSGSMEIDSDEIVKLEPRAFRPFKTKDEYLYAMKEDLAEWFKTLYEGLEILVDNFFEVLDTGVLLCKHANNVQQHARDYEKEHPGSPNFAKVKFPNGEVQYRENVKPKSFQARDNISNFIAWCRGLGIMDVLLFETDDLVLRKNEKSVILCLLEVARKGAKFGMLAPILVQMEEEIEMEIAGEEPEPFKQIIYNDHMSLDDMVSAALSVCSCPSQFPMVRVSEGKYRVGNSKTLIFVRILRNHVMVRVGGGWDTLQHYLDKHDPCRCNSLGHRIPAQPLPPKRRSSSPVPQPQLSVYQPRHSFAGTPATAANQNRSSNTRRTSATPSRPQTPTLRSSQNMLRTQDRRYRSTENLLSNSRTVSKNRPQDLMGKNFPKSMSSDKIGQQTSRRRSDSTNLSRPESTEDLRNHRRGGSHPSPRSMSLAPSEPKTRRSPSREEASRQRSRSAATVERTRPSTPTLASGRIRYSPRPNEQEKLIISRNSTGRHILSRKDTDESEKQSMRQNGEIKQSASSSNLQERQQTAAMREERPPSRIRPTTPQPMKALVRSPQEEKNDTALYITRNQGGRHEVNRDTAEKQENKTSPRRGSTGTGIATTYRSGRHTPVTMDQRDGVNSAGQSKSMRSRTPTAMLRQNSLDQDDTKSKPGSLTSPTTSEPGSIYQRRSRPSTPEPALKQGKQPVTPRGSLQGSMGFVKRPENGRRTPTLSRENSETELKEIMANATREISPRTGEPSNSRTRSKTPTSGRRTPNLKRANSVEKDLKDLKSQNDKTFGPMKSPRSRSSSKEILVENNFGSYDGGSNTKKTAGRNSLSAYSFGKPLTRSQEIKLACSTFSMPNNRKFHKRSQSITDPSEHEEIVDEAQKQLEKDFEEMEALFRTYRVEERSQSRNGGRGLSHSSSCNELSALEACDEGYTTQRNELLDSKEKGFISKRNSSMGDLTNFSLSPRMTTYDVSIVKPRRDDRAGPPTRIPTPVRPRYGAEGRLLRSDSGVEINCSVSDTYCDDMETRRSTGSDSGIDFKAFNPNEFQRQPSPAQSPTTKLTYTLNI